MIVEQKGRLANTDKDVKDVICEQPLNMRSSFTGSDKNKVFLFCFHTIQHVHRPVAIMKMLLVVLFLLIAHESTFAKPKPKPKPKPEPKPKPFDLLAGYPGGDYSINGWLEKSKFSYCKFV